MCNFDLKILNFKMPSIFQFSLKILIQTAEILLDKT